jgi:hypothetical protein
MNKISAYIIIMFSITFFSCSQEIENTDIENNNEQITESSTSVLFKNNTVYSKYFDNNVEREVGYFASREHVNPREIVGFDKSYFSKTKSTSSMTPSFANGIKLNSIGNTELTKSAGTCDFNYEKLFGRKVSFTIGNEHLKSATNSEDSVSMYVPYVIDINYPVASATELVPLCPYNDLLLEWNKDENNENGILIIVEWDGDMTGSAKKNKSIRTIDLVEDTGEAILNTELFQDIPDLAIINITILRGNVDIVDIENTAVKVYAATNSSISVVLAKEPIE